MVPIARVVMMAGFPRRVIGNANAMLLARFPPPATKLRARVRATATLLVGPAIGAPLVTMGWVAVGCASVVPMVCVLTAAKGMVPACALQATQGRHAT